MTDRKSGFDQIVDLAKNIGIVIGGLGSLAALLYWIGNAIILARLREYNLYGIVQYTDEYVKEAGYQFIQDVFTFFRSPALIMLFIIAAGLVTAFIPVGPFGRIAEKRQDKTGPDRTTADKTEQDRPAPVPVPAFVRTCLLAPVAAVKARGLHYLLFLVPAMFAAITLTANWSVKSLSADIMHQERVLKQSLDFLQRNPLLLVPQGDAALVARMNEFQQRFYAEITAGIPESGWREAEVNGALRQLGYIARSDPAGPSALVQFQRDFAIRESPEFLFNGDFEKSTTYLVLRKLLVNRAISAKVYGLVQTALADVQSLLKGHLTSEEDFSSLVIVPANYDIVNASFDAIRSFRRNLLALYAPGNDDTARLLSTLLADVRPLQFGSTMLSYSFLALIALLAYLVMNVPRLLEFRQWERGYFVLVLLLFLVIAITLPAAYGRYKFEFNVKKLTDVRLASTSGANQADPVKAKLDELFQKGASLYILGPTKGREVIIGALSNPDAPGGDLRIIMLDRDLIKFMVIQPVDTGVIPKIIDMLRHRKAEVRVGKEGTV